MADRRRSRGRRRSRSRRSHSKRGGKERRGERSDRGEAPKRRSRDRRSHGRRRRSHGRSASSERRRSRSRSTGKKKAEDSAAEGSKEEKKKGGWDAAGADPAGAVAIPGATPASAPAQPPQPTGAPRVRIQSFQEILAQVRAGILPSPLPGLPGAPGPSLQMPARPLYEMQPRGPGYAPKGEVCPQAPEEVLRNARDQAAKAEATGREASRQTGVVARGPPALPTGVMVIEQKYVDFLVGPGGQSLASINYAAGVNVTLDQTHKFSGYTIANIFGTEAATKQAKIAIEFKISQWLPRGMSYSSTGPPPPAQASRPLQPPAPPRVEGAPIYAPQDMPGPRGGDHPLAHAWAKWPPPSRPPAAGGPPLMGDMGPWGGPAPAGAGFTDMSGGVL